MMELHKSWKLCLILSALVLQSILFNWAMNGHLNSLGISMAGEVPDPGTILLFGLGALLLRHENRKHKKR